MDDKMPGLGIRSSVFWANHSFFAKKWANERIAQKTSDLLIPSFLVGNLRDSLMVANFGCAPWVNRSWSLNFGEWPERIAHGRSFLVSDLSTLLISLIKKEGISESLIFLKNRTKKYVFCQFFFSKLLVFCDQKSKWAICSKKPSDLLIYHERFAHGCSFDMSESLTVAHFIWGIWANERIPNPAKCCIKCIHNPITLYRAQVGKAESCESSLAIYKNYLYCICKQLSDQWSFLLEGGGV